MTLLVGMPVSLSGQYRSMGRQALAGLEAWARDANARTPGGFKVIHYDDASDPATVREGTRRLIVDDKVDILIGPYSSALTSAAAQVAESHGKLMWNQGGASELVYRQGYRWTVGILTPASRYLEGLLPLVRRTDPSAGTVALARAATGEFPRAVCSGVEIGAADQGFTAWPAIEFPAASEDFTATVGAIAAARPDVAVVVGRMQNDILLARQLAESGTKVGVVSVVAAGIQGFQDALSGLADRFLGPSQWEPEARYAPDFGPATEQVTASLRRDGHQFVDYPMAQAYAAGVVVQRCLEEAGTADSHALREAASNLSFTTFYGRFEIVGETGRQTGRETLLVQWQDGRKIIVWPPPFAQGSLIYPWR
ncbi:MAG: amino acid ABC transporter substrate-binding protein [Chloroflexi bacterium]|nr:amino acid ABC transporter substrate-binding protein [Chloroflexota bacterium]